VWQAIYQELRDQNFVVIAVALDSAGAAAAREPIEAAGPPPEMAAVLKNLMGWDDDVWSRIGRATYPCLIDEKHVVAELYDMVNVPTAVWIDERGRIVRPPESGGSTDSFRKMDPTTFALPEDSMLEQELCAHHKIPLGRGFKITPKDRYPGQTFQQHTVKEHLGRSPDRADALVYLYAAVTTLEVGGAPTLNRPLLLITQEEQLAAAEAELAKQEKATEEERAQTKYAEEFREWCDLLGIETKEQTETVEFPSFL